MNTINQQADDFISGDHFNADVIDGKRNSVAERFDALQEPLKGREAKLADALLLQQYLRFDRLYSIFIPGRNSVSRVGGCRFSLRSSLLFFIRNIPFFSNIGLLKSGFE